MCVWACAQADHRHEECCSDAEARQRVKLLQDHFCTYQARPCPGFGPRFVRAPPRFELERLRVLGAPAHR